MEQESRRRLPVRAGDRRNVERGRRVVEEEVRGRGHRGARVANDELGQPDGDGMLDDERRSPELGGLGCQGVPVGAPAADAEEERPGRDGARVVGEVADLDRGRAARAPFTTSPGPSATMKRSRFIARRVYPRALSSRSMSRGGKPGVRYCLNRVTRLPRKCDSGDGIPHHQAATSDGQAGTGTATEVERAVHSSWPVWTRHFRPAGLAGCARQRLRGIRRNLEVLQVELAIDLKAGAATTPPKIESRGSSTFTRTTSRGCEAGTIPTKDAV